MENKLAENIRSYRKKLDLTQEKLAERLGITLGTVSKWERGSSEPDLGFLMGLAEIFHVSVDALIGYTMRGNDADAEAERIRERKKDLPLEETLAEYENALMKFPNHFGIVFGAAGCSKQIGLVYHRERELRRAIELHRHALDLISQNADPQINEVIIRNSIAQCYSALNEHKKAIEEYKQNNLCGNNDAQIGLILIREEGKLHEGIRHTRTAFLNHLSEMFTVMSGYIVYYQKTGKVGQRVRASRWSIDFLKSLKNDPEKRCYLDKLLSMTYLTLAIGQDENGQASDAADSLRKAVQMAKAFDRNPVYTLDNVVFSEDVADSPVYDDAGPTAMESLRRIMEKDGEKTGERFRRSFALLTDEQT